MLFPTQKLFYILTPILVVLGLFVLIRTEVIKNSSNTNSGIQVVQEVKRAPITETDTDSDGIPDWKNYFPENTTDSTEQKQLTNAVGTVERYQSASNLTEALGQDLFSEYLSLKQTGEVNSLSVYALTDRLATNVSISSSKTEYAGSDIKILQDNSESALRTYGNALASIRDQWYYAYQSNPVLLSSANDPALSTEMERVGKIYGNLTKDLLPLFVPIAFAQSHLTLINNYAQTTTSLQDFSEIDSDPLRALTGIGLYLKLQEEERVILQQISTSFRQSGIIFKAEESGSFWNTL